MKYVGIGGWQKGSGRPADKILLRSCLLSLQEESTNIKKEQGDERFGPLLGRVFSGITAIE